MDTVKSLLVEIGAENADLKRKLEESKRKLKEFGDQAVQANGFASNATARFKSQLASIGPAIAGAFTVGAMVQFTRSVVTTTATFERYQTVLANTFGDAGLAENYMGMISDFASQTPYSVDELTDSFVRLANRGFVPTRNQMVQLGDLASSTGKSFGQLTEAILDAGTGEFERLKEFGIKAKAEGDRVSFSFKGVTTEVDNSEQAIQDYILSLGNLEGVTGGMVAQSETLGGKLSNLGDAYDQFLVGVGEKSSGVFSSVIQGFTAMLNNMTDTLNGEEYLKKAGLGDVGGFFSDIDEQMTMEATKLLSIEAGLVGASKEKITAAIAEIQKKLGYYTGESGKAYDTLYSYAMNRLAALYGAQDEMEKKQTAARKASADQRAKELAENAANKTPATTPDWMIEGEDPELKAGVGWLTAYTDQMGEMRKKEEEDQKAHLERLNQMSQEGLDKKLEQQQEHWDAVKEHREDVASAFLSASQMEIDSIEDVGNVLVATIKQEIAAYLAKAIANVLVKESEKGLLGVVTGAAAGAGMAALFSAIPSFAEGGDVYGPQLAWVGDNPGRHEKIIPSEQFGQLGGGMNGSLALDLNATISGRDLLITTRRAQRAYHIKTGR